MADEANTPCGFAFRDLKWRSSAVARFCYTAQPTIRPKAVRAAEEAAQHLRVPRLVSN
jgi:hypothetical protein